MSSTPGAGPARVAVMGSGSWGTAFALVLSDAGNDGDAVGPAAGAGRR